jgi:hypothetical protein
MKKLFLALAASALLLAPAKGFAQSFQHKTGYSINVGTEKPPACPAGTALRFDGTNYSCTNRIDNLCGDGEVVVRVDPATGATVCERVRTVTDCFDPNNPLRVQVGVDNKGNVICGNMPQPQCHISHARNNFVGQFFISYADCAPDEFLLTGGASSAVPMGPGYGDPTQHAAWCWGMGGNGYGFIHRSHRAKDPHNGLQAWMADSYADLDSLGNSQPRANNCTHSYAVCCKYPGGVSPGNVPNINQAYPLVQCNGNNSAAVCDSMALP